MQQPLEYQQKQAQMMRARRRSAGRTFGIGATILLISLLLVPAPLLLGPGVLNKYIVLIGLLGMCVGLSCLLHGGWDWIRQWRG